MLSYKLVKAKNENIETIIKYKLATILTGDANLNEDEINKITNYVNENVPNQINDYKLITIEKEIVGIILVYQVDDGYLLDEIYLEESYRNNGIGTDIIKNILNTYKIVYLWVYKNNLKAINLYQKLNFKIIDETKTRYFMKHE